MLTPEDSGAVLLVARDGQAVGRAWLTPDAEPPRAEELAAVGGAGPAEVAEVAVVDLAGMRVSTQDAAIADALVEAGGRLVRNAVSMTRRLGADDDGARTDDRIVPWDRAPGAATTPAALASASVAAYPPEHPDFVTGDDDAANAAVGIASILAGTAIGAFDAGCSAVALDGTDVVGAILITVVAADPVHDWGGGTWIADVFVAPSHAGQGLGRALLDHALARSVAAGHEWMGLAVTVGNPARRLYEAAGFVTGRTSCAVVLPGRSA